MLRFLAAMVIPLWVLVYTVQFGRWMHKKRLRVGAWSAYTVGAAAFVAAGVVLWRVCT
ncbi:hypothetical protein GCM10025857_15750 [Alicyclobacillus contaminans]|uniref:hypothetical protein n=1 Tax=Alicyclobacillus contaminans TaxID=392016 RepID=UPI0004141F76|nr:hypothetical protein [Alicyclobacillus contaminans]GMA50218.1 hypothetical protein GCM10025857_15750 [Alicyclobacillus contaminans]